MTEGETLYRNILLEPGNDYHRLVYADWLEDQGEHGHAEYIRAAVELASEDGGGSGSRRRELARLTRRVPQSCRDVWFGSLLRESLKPTQVRWERGFPASIALTAEQFVRHRGELFSRHPITQVRLADRQPLQNSEGFFVWSNWRFSPPTTPCAIGETLFSLVVEHPKHIIRVNYPIQYLDIIARFNSAEDAETALSAACVQMGRESARRLIGLPEMVRS